MSIDPTTRAAQRLDPQIAWTALTEAPLRGLGLAREAGALLAWDDADRLYLFGPDGDLRSTAQAGSRISTAVISDDGSRVVVLAQGPRLLMLDGDLGVVGERSAPPDPLAVAIDPHGRFALVTSRFGSNHFYNRHARPAGKFEALQPLAHALFVADRPFLVAAAAYGLLAGFDLEAGHGGKLGAEVAWVDKQLSGVGRLAASGDGAVILASCFTHGVQRYDVNGNNEGAYHLGGTVRHAVPDFAGRIFAVATEEGGLSLLNTAGNVRWKTELARPAVALEVDALGRHLYYGHDTGEVVRLELYGGDRPRSAASASATAGARAGSGNVRRPDWTTPAVPTEDQAETAVLAVLDDPGRVGLYAMKQRLRIFDSGGEDLGTAPEILGVGRILRTAPGWMAAATDRQILLYHAHRNAAQRLDLSLVEVTHLLIRPDDFGLAVVQERDRIGRATTGGRWIWKDELKAPVEDLAIGPAGYCALTDDRGRLVVRDPAGQVAGTFQSEPEPLLLIEAPDDAPDGLTWMTLARRAQVLRGHDRDGRVAWESPVAWEGWQLQRLGPIALVIAPDGRVQAFDGSGHLRGQGKATTASQDLFGVTPAGEPRRVSRQDVHLICADLDGRVRWRAVCNEPIGPFAVGSTGVAAIVGKTLAWFHGLD